MDSVSHSQSATDDELPAELPPRPASALRGLPGMASALMLAAQLLGQRPHSRREWHGPPVWRSCAYRLNPLEVLNPEWRALALGSTMAHTESSVGRWEWAAQSVLHDTWPGQLATFAIAPASLSLVARWAARYTGRPLVAVGTLGACDESCVLRVAADGLRVSAWHSSVAGHEPGSEPDPARERVLSAVFPAGGRPRDGMSVADVSALVGERVLVVLERRHGQYRVASRGQHEWLATHDVGAAELQEGELLTTRCERSNDDDTEHALCCQRGETLVMLARSGAMAGFAVAVGAGSSVCGFSSNLALWGELEMTDGGRRWRGGRSWGGRSAMWELTRWRWVEDGGGQDEEILHAASESPLDVCHARREASATWALMAALVCAMHGSGAFRGAAQHWPARDPALHCALEERLDWADPAWRGLLQHVYVTQWAWHGLLEEHEAVDAAMAGALVDYVVRLVLRSERVVVATLGGHDEAASVGLWGGPAWGVGLSARGHVLLVSADKDGSVGVRREPPDGAEDHTDELRWCALLVRARLVRRACARGSAVDELLAAHDGMLMRARH